MGRHWHAVNVRVDGLAPVLGRLLNDTRIRSAALVDVDSGMVLDACGGDHPADDPAGARLPDLEVLSAGHADLVRVTLAVLHGPDRRPGRCEVVADDGAGHHHVLRVLPDAHGGPLALSVVVAGPERVVSRVRRRLRRVSSAALTAGPSTARRPPATREQAMREQAARERVEGERAVPDRVLPDRAGREPAPGGTGLRVVRPVPTPAASAAVPASASGSGPRAVIPPAPRAAPPSALPPSRR